MRRIAMGMLLAAAAGCASKKPDAPETQPAPANKQATPAVASTRFTGFVDVDLEGANAPDNVPEDVFAGVSIAAAGWAKGTATSGAVGLVYPDGASLVFKRALDAVAQKYAWRPMRPNEVVVVCGAGNKSLTQATCYFRNVVSVFRLNRLLLRGDSSWASFSISKVPSGSREVQTFTYCVDLAYQGTGWVAKHGEKVINQRLCPRPPGMP